MKILVNCSNLKTGGGLQVAHSIIYELRQYWEHGYVIVMSDQVAELVDEVGFPDNFTFIRHTRNFSLDHRCEALDGTVRDNRVDVVLSVFGPTYWRPEVPHVCGFAKPQYIYTDSPFFKSMDLRERVKLWIKKVVHLRSFRTANVLFTENEDVSARLREMFEDKTVYTATNYYNQVFEHPERWNRSITLPEFKGMTLLTIAANYPHKNLQIIPRVISCLKANRPAFKFRFVVSVEEAVFGKLDDDVRRHLVFLGKVNVDQCPHLYEQADMMFLPTLLECFSASYPEAMYMKKPILTSDLHFARGLCGEAALYFDPLSEEDIAQKIISLSEDGSLRQKLTEEGVRRLNVFDRYDERAKKILNIVTNETNNSRP